MTLKTRIARLESEQQQKSKGKFWEYKLHTIHLEICCDGIPMQARINAMKEAEVTAFAFNDQADSRMRQMALRRLIKMGLDVSRAKATLNELMLADMANIEEEITTLSPDDSPQQRKRVAYLQGIVAGMEDERRHIVEGKKRQEQDYTELYKLIYSQIKPTHGLPKDNMRNNESC